MNIPPYNGWGNEIDSIGNCLRLIPKKPKKDYYKYIDNDSIILRFLARLNSKNPEDAERKLLISFFLSDDSIQIYEIPKKNSGKKFIKFLKFLYKIILINYLFIQLGIWEGKLLERGKYNNEENNNAKFTISDFEVNKSVKINSFSFYILDADDFTKKWIAGNLI